MLVDTFTDRLPGEPKRDHRRFLDWLLTDLAPEEWATSRRIDRGEVAHAAREWGWLSRREEYRGTVAELAAKLEIEKAITKTRAALYGARARANAARAAARKAEAWVRDGAPLVDDSVALAALREVRAYQRDAGELKGSAPGEETGSADDLTTEELEILVRAEDIRRRRA